METLEITSRGQPLKFAWWDVPCQPSRFDLSVDGSLTDELAVSDALRQVFAALAARKETRIIVVSSECHVMPHCTDVWTTALDAHLADRQFIYTGEDHLSMLLLYDPDYLNKYPSHVIFGV